MAIRDREFSLLLKDVAALSACVSLDRTSDPRRTLPVIPPAALWRILPRLLRRAADAAGCDLDDTSKAFMRAQAAIIEGGPAAAPLIGDGVLS